MPFFGGWLRKFGSRCRHARPATPQAPPSLRSLSRCSRFSLGINASNIDVRRTIETAAGVGSGAGIPDHRTASGEQHR